MAFFEINNTWELIVYWIGVCACIGFLFNILFGGSLFLFLMGGVLLGIWFNLNWGENIFKTRKEGLKFIVIDKKLKGVEKIFFLLGFLTLFLFVGYLFFLI